MSQEAEMLLPPREAAALLEVAPSTLRRLGTVYTQVYGEDALPWSDGGRGGGSRLWTGEALRRTRAARQLVEAGRAASFEVALRQLQAAPEGTVALPPTIEPLDLLALLERIEALERRDAERAERVAALETEIESIRALPAAPTTSSEQPEIGTEAQPDVPLQVQADVEHPERSEGDGPLVRLARRLEHLLGRRK